MSDADGTTEDFRREMEEAEALFAEFHRRQDRGEVVDFERLCRDHPRLEEGLRSLHSVSGTPRDATAAQGAHATVADPKGALGTAIGPYKLLEVLGKGGMGVVYLAEQRQPVHRRVALKVIKLGMDTKEVIARFEAERQALALMSHPSIARVLDVGATADGRPFFVMEHVPGEPITEYCDRHRLSTRERLELFVQVCAAVQHAHQKAIIHRDLKPSNVLVTVQDGKRLPKVIDFGIAKAIGHRLTEKTLHTELGQLIGTLEYMSPEQAEMGALDIDTRTDIYSLGVILYELLTAKLPFSAEELRRAGYAEIQRIIREREPPRPSTRLSTLGDASERVAERRSTDLGRLLRELRGDLDWMCMKALEKDRLRRYGTASELAVDITRHLNHEPVLAGPPDMRYRAKKFLRKHRGPVAAAAGILVALVVGLVTSLVLYVKARDAMEYANAESGARKKALTEKTQALAEKTQAVFDKDRALEDLKKEAKAREEVLQRAEGLRLTAQSSAELATNPGLALLLAIEGAKRYPGLLANNALLDALQSTRERRTLRHLGSGFWGFADFAEYSPDGRHVVTGSGDKTAWIWDAETGKEIVPLRGHEDEVHHAAFSPDGKRVVTASIDKTARIWDAETGKEIVWLRGHERAVDRAVFSPDGKRVVTASWDKTARIWDAETGKEIIALRGHEDKVHHAAFSPDGKRVVTVSIDKTARIWDAETGKEIVPLRGHGGPVYHAAFSPDGRRVVTASYDNTARIWDVEAGKEIVPLRGHGDPVEHAAFSPDGKRVVTVSIDKTARIWDAETGKEVVSLKGHESGVHAAFSPDGKRVVTASWGKTAWIWDAETGKEVVALRGHEGPIVHAAFSSDWKRVVTASWDGTARIWDGETGKEIVALGHKGQVYYAVFSPDGKRVVTASSDKTAQIWDAETGNEIFSLRGHESAVDRAVFSPDGKRVVTASWDKTARIWDAETGNEIVALRGHEDKVRRASFSPDGKRVVTASEDKTARIWDAETGREIVSLKKGHESGVYHAAFSPDGKRVVTASYDNTARIWPVDLLPIAENRRPRDLTPEERDRFEIEPPSHPSER